MPKINSNYFVHESSIVDSGVTIGSGTKIWHFSHIMPNADIGKNCSFGQNVFVADGVIIGNNVKVQNNVSIYEGVTIEDDVFLGPSCVLTNITNPRSQIVRRGLYKKSLFKRGATVGANATIICGVTLGRYCLIAAGAVVVKDVSDYALMMGVPAIKKGWVSRHGIPLTDPDNDGIMICAESRFRYKEVTTGILRCLDIDEEAPLPKDKSIGLSHYDSFK